MATREWTTGNIIFGQTERGRDRGRSEQTAHFLVGVCGERSEDLIDCIYNNLFTLQMYRSTSRPSSSEDARPTSPSIEFVGKIDCL